MRYAKCDTHLILGATLAARHNLRPVGFPPLAVLVVALGGSTMAEKVFVGTAEAEFGPKDQQTPFEKFLVVMRKLIPTSAGKLPPNKIVVYTDQFLQRVRPQLNDEERQHFLRILYGVDPPEESFFNRVLALMEANVQNLAGTIQTNVTPMWLADP